MNEIPKKRSTLLLAAALLGTLALNACAGGSGAQNPAGTGGPEPAPEAVSIALSDTGVTVDGAAAAEAREGPVFLSHDIIYYQDRDAYDSGNPYGEGTSSERHSAGEAAAHTVVNITQPGTYRLSGTLSQGQVFVDLGEDAQTDPDAVVTLILDSVDITCTVAPAVFFYRVYECDQDWVAFDSGTGEYTPSAARDTSRAGANAVIADGAVNHVTGSHVARIYKDSDAQKKLHKYDGAFYSRQSMNISGGAAGTGVLNITADNEGLDSELHLTINGGNINIQSQNDGINTNEDGISVTTVNGGALRIAAGLGDEGDGIDSNGFLVINGGVVISNAKPQSDSGLDSDCGTYINGGYVVATGSSMDWADGDSTQVTMNLQFSSLRQVGEAIIVTDSAGNVVFAYDPALDGGLSPWARGYQGAVVSCPQFRLGESCQVYLGGQIEGKETGGLYDPSTVTGFTGAVLQQYTGTEVGHGGFRPDGEGFPSDGEGLPPDGEGFRPDGEGFRPDGEGFRPDGEGFRPDGEGFRPDGQMPDAPLSGDRPGGFPGNMPEGMDGTPSTQFMLLNYVNAFGGVRNSG